MRQALHRVRRGLRWIFVTTLLVSALVLCMNNQNLVTFSLMPFGYEAEMPLYLLVISALVIGFILAMVGALPRQWRLSAHIRRLQQRVHNLEASLNQQHMTHQIQTELSTDEIESDVQNIPQSIPNALRPDSL